MKFLCMTKTGLLARVLFVALALSPLAPATAALPEAEMTRLLRDQPLPFQYECTAPLTRKFRIEDHETAKRIDQLKRQWRQCVGEFNKTLLGFVALELEASAAPAAGMSAEQRSRYQDALRARVKAELEVLKSSLQASAALVNEAITDFNSRIGEMGYPEEEFQKVVKRFDALEYHCAAPEPISAKVQGLARLGFYNESSDFLYCGRAWEHRAAEFLEMASQGRHDGLASPKEYQTMSIEQRKRFDALVSRAQTKTIEASIRKRERAEAEHAKVLEKVKRSDR